MRCGHFTQLGSDDETYGILVLMKGFVHEMGKLRRQTSPKSGPEPVWRSFVKNALAAEGCRDDDRGGKWCCFERSDESGQRGRRGCRTDSSMDPYNARAGEVVGALVDQSFVVARKMMTRRRWWTLITMRKRRKKRKRS